MYQVVLGGEQRSGLERAVLLGDCGGVVWHWDSGSDWYSLTSISQLDYTKKEAKIKRKRRNACVAHFRCFPSLQVPANLPSHKVTNPKTYPKIQGRPTTRRRDQDKPVRKTEAESLVWLPNILIRSLHYLRAQDGALKITVEFLIKATSLGQCMNGHNFSCSLRKHWFYHWTYSLTIHLFTKT